MRITDAQKAIDVSSFFKKNNLDPSLGVIIAFSGGSDSMALAIALSRVVPHDKLVAVHVDHQIRSEKELEIEHRLVNENCMRLRIRLEMVHLGKHTVTKLAEQRHGGIEEAARILRRKALEEVATRYHFSFIATGHTADDQAETVLTRILQGGYIAGPKGIAEVNGPYIRPLLKYSKQELVEMVKQTGLMWSEDSTNADTGYTRNALRTLLIPHINALFPNYRQALGQLGEKSIREDAVIEQMADEQEPLVCRDEKDSIIIDLEKFFTLEQDVRYKLIYRAWNNLNEKKTMETALRLPFVAVQRVDDFFHDRYLHYGQLDVRGCTVYVDNRRATMLLTSVLLDRGWLSPVYPLHTPLMEHLVLARLQNAAAFKEADERSLWIDETQFIGNVIVRSVQTGDEIELVHGTKKISDLLSEWNITQRDRHLVPVLEDQKGIVAVFGRVFGGKDRLAKRMLLPGDLDRKRFTLYSVIV